MTLRRWIVAYLLVVHGAVLAFAVVLFREDPPWLFLSEAGIALSFLLGVWLVRKVFVPFEIVATGTELLEESDFTTRFVETGSRDVDALVKVYNAMAASLLDERRNVQEQSSLTRRIVSSMPTAVVVCDFDGRIESLNPAAGELAGGVSLKGRMLVDLTEPPFHLLASLRPGQSEVSIVGPRRYRCTRIEFEDRSFGRSWYLVDELTRELRASERAAYATLIRTISHEVNNSVGAIASMLDGVATSAGTAERTADVMRVSSERLRNLSRFVNDYAELVRIPPPALRPTDLNQLVRDVAMLYGGSPGVAIRTELAEDLPEIALDRNQIEQALINIVKNAREATGPAGQITIRTATGGRGSRRAATNDDRDSPLVVLTVHDTGPGISDPDRVFTPFYSTRDEGRGLGLTIVAQILDNHSFDYTLENARGGGAIFTIEMKNEK